MKKIHATAIVHSKAKIAAGVEIGPYAIVDEHVSIGANTTIDSHAVITGHTDIGEDNRIGVGAVIGLEPQDISYNGEKSFVKIGNKNKIREYVQIHRGTKEGSITELGDNNFLLGFSHIAHNCKVGSNVIFANGALLGGYVEVGDCAFISGHCLVHQHCRVGPYAMMRGGARVSLDVPPYCISDDANAIRGINVVGLERRGFTNEQIRKIKECYKELFQSQKPLSASIQTMLDGNPSPEIRVLLEFIKSSPRGICRPEA